MKIEEVKRLDPTERFLYWCRERHNIAMRRRCGLPKPWTDDEVLQSYFFTHPYREMDKVTVWFRDHVRDPLRNDPRVLFATVAFRWFNLPATAEVLMDTADGTDDGGLFSAPPRDLLLDWDASEALKRLGKVRDSGGQVFTGAYMINSPGGEPKLEAIVRRVTNVWRDSLHLVERWWANGRDKPVTMESAHTVLTAYDGMGGFMAYEVVCDLRYTYLLEKAPDKLTWCHVGPGARRGLYRVLGVPFPKGNNAAGCPRVLNDAEEMTEMRKLLALCRKKLKGMSPFEMREVEHVLCETDKYNRALEGDGQLKRRYDGK